MNFNSRVPHPIYSYYDIFILKEGEQHGTEKRVWSRNPLYI
jgi:hypothetical protein